MIPLIFPQEPRNAGLQIQRVIKKRCVYSKEQKLWNERVKSRGEKKERKKKWQRESAEGGREGGVNTSVPLKPSEETDLNGAFLLFIIIKGNNPPSAKSTNYRNFWEERIVREARNTVPLLS